MNLATANLRLGLAAAVLAIGPDALGQSDRRYTFTKIIDTGLPQYTRFPDPVLNDFGQLAMKAELSGGGSALLTAEMITPANQHESFVTSPVEFGFSFPSINNSGHVAFRASSITGQEDVDQTMVWDGASLSVRVDESGTITDLGDSAVINDAGVVVVTGDACDVSSRDAVYGATGLNSVVKRADACTQAQVQQFIKPTINNNGDIAFIARRQGQTTYALGFIGAGDPLNQLTLFGGDAKPNALPDLNDLGVIAGITDIGDGSGQGVYTLSTQGIEPVATFADGFTSFAYPNINNAGTVSFIGVTPQGTGIYTGPDAVRDKVIATGDTLFEGTVTYLNAIVGTLNNAGQIAFEYQLDNGAFGVAVAELDTDGDGVPDDWESVGVPYHIEDGVTGYVSLPDADPMRKNLWVELDRMAGVAFEPQAVELVEAAFAQAPVMNPDGTTGITLHIRVDESDLPRQDVWPLNEDLWPVDFDTYRANHFGLVEERGETALLAAKAKAWRYAVAAVKGSDNIGGVAQGIPADNFIIFVPNYTTESKAAVFMHELGHCLGLRHGGGDNTNGKPNYPSIMNYVLSYRKPWNTAFWKLDYSRTEAGDFATIDENAIDEVAGIGVQNGYYSDWQMPFGIWLDEGGGLIRRTASFVRLNGTPTDFGDTQGFGYLDGNIDFSVAQDLNYALDPPVGISLPGRASPGQPLSPHDDWGNIVLPLLSVRGQAAAAAAEPFPDDELTEEAVEWLEQNMPTPPSDCPADLNGDGVVDQGDIQTYIALFFAADVAADLNGDGIVDLGDIQAFVAAFIAGC